MPGTESAAYPFWSPDNQSIAFFTSGELRRVGKKGGDPLTICNVAVARGGVWMSDHRILYGSLTAGLFVVSDSPGTPASLTTPDTSRSEISHRWPQVLPGGRFLYWVQSGKAGTQGIHAASLARPAEAVKLVSANNNGLYAPADDGSGYLLWLQGETLVARELDLETLALTGEIHQIANPVTGVGITNQMNVAVSAGGLLLYSATNAPGQFAWIDRAAPGKRPLNVVGEPGQYGAFRLSPDRRRVAVTRDRPDGIDICLLEVERGVPNPLTFLPDSFIHPIWSPSGLTLLFTSYSTRNLYRKDADAATAERRITQSAYAQYAADWSRDGRWVLYWEIAPDTQRDLWLRPMTPEGDAAADAKPQRYLSSPANETWVRFSPEPSPRWVAFPSDETGHYEVHVDAFPQPRGKKRVSTDGGTYPLWGAEGRELFYVSPDSAGAPQARVVDPFPPDEHFVVWIGTKGVTRNVAQIQGDSRVTLLYFDRASFSYVTLVGTARIVRDPAEKATHWKEAWASMYKDKNRGDDYTLICVAPSRLEILSPAHGLMPDLVTGRPVMLNLR